MLSDGFTGISINNMTFSNDILLVVVFLLLAGFAAIFRKNISLFQEMKNGIINKEQKNRFFGTVDKENFLFNVFMSFQTILLLSIYVFSLTVKYGYIESPDIKRTLLCIVGLVFLFLVFHIVKIFIFRILLYMLAETDVQKMLTCSYNSLFRLWGVFLYIPVFWMLLIGDYVIYVFILLIISYILFRIILAYRFIYTFLGKNIWLLFLNLYLCAQEIVPLVFLYEGLKYMYNMIDKNNIWQ